MAAARYHISAAPAPLPFAPPVRFHLQENDEYVKYGHPPFPTPGRGDSYWTPEIITQTWFMAETGKIPISGAGYGGPFAGPGFDAIWLDMSEIVRPTRDGIHGREYISTSVDLGRKLSSLRGDDVDLATLPPIVELPLPVVFNPYPFPLPRRTPVVAIARAAAALHTLAVITPEMWGNDLMPFAHALAPRLPARELDHHEALWADARYVELEGEEFAEATARIKAAHPETVVGWRVPLDGAIEERVEAMVRAGAEVIHLYADEYGQSTRGFIADVLRSVHRHLVAAGIRDEVTLLASGGIATAEHVPKAIVCGADLVAIDFTLLLAFGCGLWADKTHCAAEAGEFAPEWGAQRLINLMAAWHDQLLECLGAMGMREVRRLRGETGRAIFQPEEEAAFRSLFASTHPAPPAPEETEVPTMGDLRWTPDLLQATWTQAATGQPPVRGEYAIGRSGGGFDILRFAVEVDGSRHAPTELSPEEIDLSLLLNRRGDGPPLTIALPFYGGGMSFGSVSLQTMLARAIAAKETNTFTSTGEGGYPDELIPYADYVITQVATGLFGVREETIQLARFVEFKYAQGAKPGLGGHLLGGKTTEVVASMREAVAWTSLFSPFPFHSVYSVEDHKKHVDWIRTVNPRAIVSVKVSTPTDVDMVAVGIYHAGAHVVHLDGGYGGTGAAPEIAKKNIAMPIEYAIPKVHRFLVNEGIRDEIVLVASGGIRSAYDIAKCIALGADGAVIGMADLVALGCTRLADCEKGKGCPFGITTTDPELAELIDSAWGAQRIANLYRAWATELRHLLARLGLRSIAALRGRTDLLVYLVPASEKRRGETAMSTP